MPRQRLERKMRGLILSVQLDVSHTAAVHHCTVAPPFPLNETTTDVRQDIVQQLKKASSLVSAVQGHRKCEYNFDVILINVIVLSQAMFLIDTFIYTFLISLNCIPSWIMVGIDEMRCRLKYDQPSQANLQVWTYRTNT